MRHSNSPLATLRTQAAHWCVLGMMAVALARQILCLERSGGQTAYQQACALEAWSCSALTLLAQEIAETDASGPPPSPEAAHDRRGLLLVFSTLTTLMLMARQIQQRLAASARKWRVPARRERTGNAMRRRIFAPGYLDSS